MLNQGVGDRRKTENCVYQNGIVFEAFVGICMERTRVGG
jgi:hypothetical protein